MTMIREYLGLKPTMTRFVAQLLRSFPRGEAKEWVFDEAEGVLQHHSGTQINLQNMFLEYCASKRPGRGDLIRKYADLANVPSAEIPSLWVAAAKNIYPVVRSQFVETTIEIKRRNDPRCYSQSVATPLAGDLQVRLVYDFGNYLSYVTEKHIAIWGQSESDVRERALANLAKLEKPEWVDSGTGFFQLASPMSFNESMLLFDRVVDQLPFQQNAVLIPCNRGILLAADGRSMSALQSMLSEAIRCHEQEPWPMTATLCTRVKGQWQEFRASDDTARVAHNLFVIDRATFYTDQKGALDNFHAETGRDVFTASCLVRAREEINESICVWTQDVTSLLPVTDFIALTPTDEAIKSKLVRWQNVLDICGYRMQPTSESPTRFLVETFPDTNEWDALVNEESTGSE